MRQALLTDEEVVRRGEELYRETIQDALEPEHNGEFLAIDISSGDYELGTENLAALDRLKARRPGAVPYIRRVGYDTAVSIGGRSLRRP